MFRPPYFLFATEGFCLRAEQHKPLLSWLQLIYTAVRAVTWMVNHSLSLQSLWALGKRSEQTAAQTPTQAKFLLDEGFTNQLWNNRKAWVTGPWFLNNRNLSKTNWLSFKQTPCLSLFFPLSFADFPISKQQLDPFSSKQTWITKECCSAILNRFAHFSFFFSVSQYNI